MVLTTIGRLAGVATLPCRIALFMASLLVYLVTGWPVCVSYWPPALAAIALKSAVATGDSDRRRYSPTLAGRFNATGVSGCSASDASGSSVAPSSSSSSSNSAAAPCSCTSKPASSPSSDGACGNAIPSTTQPVSTESPASGFDTAVRVAEALQLTTERAQHMVLVRELTDPRDMRWVAEHGLRTCKAVRSLGQGARGRVDLTAVELPHRHGGGGGGGGADPRVTRVLLAARKVTAKAPGWLGGYRREKRGLGAGRISAHVVRLLAAARHGPGESQMLLQAMDRSLFDVVESELDRSGWRAESGAPLLPDAATRRVGWGLLRALSCLHAQGVMHRDVKTENVLLRDCGCSCHQACGCDPDAGGGAAEGCRCSCCHCCCGGLVGEVALADFDSCARMDAQGLAYGVAGTLGYKAPEVPLPDDEEQQPAGAPRRGYGAAADAFSLGNVLAECAVGPWHATLADLIAREAEPAAAAQRQRQRLPAGQRCYDEGEREAALGAHDALVLRVVRGCLSAQLGDLLRGLLQPDPADRTSLQDAARHPFFRGAAA